MGWQMPSSGGIVLSVALGSVGSSLQHQHPEQESTCGAVPSTARVLCFIGSCWASVAQELPCLIHSDWWKSWAVVLHGNPRMLKALLLSLASLKEGKRCTHG